LLFADYATRFFIRPLDDAAEEMKALSQDG